MNLIKAKGGKTIGLKAELDTGRYGQYQREYRLKIDSAATDDDFKRSLALELEEGIAGLKEDSYSERIILPGELDDGIEVRWFSEKKKWWNPSAGIFSHDTDRIL